MKQPNVQCYSSKYFLVKCANKPKLREIEGVIDGVIFGVIITKKIGNAVCRNNIKRRIKHIMRYFASTAEEASICSTFLFIAKRGIPNANFDELKRSILFSLNLFLQRNTKNIN